MKSKKFKSGYKRQFKVATYAEISPQAITILGGVVKRTGLNKCIIAYIKYSNQNCNEYALLMKVVFCAAKDCSCLV